MAEGTPCRSRFSELDGGKLPQPPEQWAQAHAQPLLGAPAA